MNKLIGATLAPDVGNLKKLPGEYDNLQNVRGWGMRIAQRRGIGVGVTISSGVMGLFDLQNDGDPLSPDKIAVITYDGRLILYDFSELTTAFDFLFSTGITLILQSSDDNWWECTVDSTTGLITTTAIAAPATTISEDLDVRQDQFFGFNDSTGAWRVQVDAGTGTLSTRRYGTTTGIEVYSSNQAFVKTVGPVFQDSQLVRWRMGIGNDGLITTTAI